ncbi:MAG: DUF2846 domain-containing protein [Nitrospirales bacterium]
MKKISESNEFKKTVALGLVFTFLFGCHSLQTNQKDSRNPAPQVSFELAPNEKRAELYFYRPNRSASEWATPQIYINKQYALSLRNQAYQGFSIPSGEYLIETRHGPDWIAGKTSQVTLPVKKGHRYFIRVLAETTFDGGNFFLSIIVPGSALFMGSDFPLIIVEEEKALKELWDMNVRTIDWDMNARTLEAIRPSNFQKSQ